MQELEGISLVFPEDCRAFEGLLRAHRGLVETRFWGVRPWTRALMPKCYRMLGILFTWNAEPIFPYWAEKG